MIFKLICSIFVAIYYVYHIICFNKKEKDKKNVKAFSISLIVVYIIYLVLIWIIV